MRNFKTEAHLFGETETHGADTGGLDILSAVKDKRQAAAYEPAIKLFLSLSSKKMCIPFVKCVMFSAVQCFPAVNCLNIQSNATSA